MRSKEFTNFTYDLTSSNKLYLEHFVAGVCAISHQDAHNYIREIETDSKLAVHIQTELKNHRRGNEIDGEVFYGRRLGWYAIVRAMKPLLVVETGTEKGLGSLVIAAALLKNGVGRLITIDIEPMSGFLIGGDYERVTQRIKSDSLSALSQIDGIDLFIHDSDHRASHEAAELRLVTSRLSANGIVVSDNAHVTTELAKWSLQSNRQFKYFSEEPLNHWYPGGGIGASRTTQG